jgi:hypothetical protein
MRAAILMLVLIGVVARLSGQDAEKPRYADPISMPGDRAEDSYEIYSQLLKSGPIEWREVKRSQWLMEATTSAKTLETPCNAAPHSGGFLNPHSDVEAPEDRKAEWNEVLADYDQHCHDVIELAPSSFKTELPVHLLQAEEKQKYMKDPVHPAAEFANAAGLHRFSEVYFNADHTLALVEQGMWCGGLCGNWTLVVLERKDGEWKMLPWVRSVVFS